MFALRKADGTNLNITGTPIIGSAGLMNVTQMISGGDGTTNHITAAIQMNHLIHSSSFKPLILLACADCKNLGTPSNKDEESFNAAFRLIKHGNKIAQKKAFTMLGRVMKHAKQETLRFKAADVLIQHQSGALKKDAIKTLLGLAAKAVSEEMRYDAAHSLAQFGDTAAKKSGITVLRQLLHDDHDTDVNFKAAYSLAMFGDEASKKEGIDFLITTASEKVDLEEIRLGSARYLIRLNDQNAKAEGIKTLRHLATNSRDKDIRLEATKALAEIGIKLEAPKSSQSKATGRIFR